MIDLSTYRDSAVAVMGLGRSGLAAAEALQAGGARVSAWDDDAGRRADAAERGVSVSELDRCDWANTSMLVWSPGIPHLHPRPHPVAQQARRAGCEIVCDIELLYRAQRGARFIGITGTNGKSTTTALIAHILKSAGRKTAVGGNLGPAALSLQPLGAGGFYVLEMSSYQLDLAPTLAFDIAVLLNVSPDHLDRHGGMHGYVAAKRRIFARQDASDVAVIGTDDLYAEAIHASVAATRSRRVIPITATHLPAIGGVSGRHGLLRDDIDGGGAVVLDLNAVPTLPGPHNWQNAAAAYAATRAAGIAPAAIAEAIATYRGLPHRQELVATIAGIRYVNDSKATNADSTARALACYDAIYWIAGGLAKDGGIKPLAPWFDRIIHAFLIGAAEDEFAMTLDGRVAWTRCGELATALRRAHAMAQADRRTNAVILLSPACASFDQWPNFEVRGDAFRTMAIELAAGNTGTPEAAPQ